MANCGVFHVQSHLRDHEEESQHLQKAGKMIDVWKEPHAMLEQNYSTQMQQSPRLFLVAETYGPREIRIINLSYILFCKVIVPGALFNGGQCSQSILGWTTA